MKNKSFNKIMAKRIPSRLCPVPFDLVERLHP